MTKFPVLLLIFITLATTWSCYQTNQGTCDRVDDPFSHLREIESKETEAHLYVVDSEAQVFDKKLKDLDKNDPLHYSEGCDAEMTLIAITSIDSSDMKYAIIYGHCPEPEFHIHAADDPSKYYGGICGTRMYIPGNGNLYVSGHVNSNFPLNRKFAFDRNGFQEVKQAYYDVGLKTKTLKPMTLYETKDLKNVVASLPENYDIEVLLSESYHESNSLYLVKTNFGLVGWTRIRAAQYVSNDVEGIFWNGD